MNDKSREERDSDFICRDGHMKVARSRIAKDKAEENFVSVFLIVRFCVQLESAEMRVSPRRRFFLKGIDSNKVQSREDRHGERQSTSWRWREHRRVSPWVVVFRTISIDHLVLRTAFADCPSDLDKLNLTSKKEISAIIKISKIFHR